MEVNTRTRRNAENVGRRRVFSRSSAAFQWNRLKIHHRAEFSRLPLPPSSSWLHLTLFDAGNDGAPSRWFSSGWLNCVFKFLFKQVLPLFSPYTNSCQFPRTGQRYDGYLPGGWKRTPPSSGTHEAMLMLNHSAAWHTDEYVTYTCGCGIDRI